MFRRKTKSKNSFVILPSSNRGSDIVKPNNTSLIVNESNEESNILHRELTSIFSEDEDVNLDDNSRRSSSLMKSLSQKKQSTPLSQSFLPDERDSQEKENTCSQFHKSRVSRPPKEIFQRSVAENVPYFEQIIRTCGAIPLPGDSSYLMCVDQAMFSINVSKVLKEDTEKNKKFMSSLKEYIKEHNNLQRMLIHTLTSENCEAARGPVQEPLMRLLLNVDCLQTDLIDVLLNRVAGYTMDKEVSFGNTQIVSSILCQMKFLCKTNDIRIASKLFEIIDISTVNVKREIIFLLPEIVSEKETEGICIQLVERLKFDEILTPVIIDAMTSLPLSSSLRSLVCLKVLNRLDKCPLEFLPSLVQFVLNRCQVEEISEVINGLRNNLPFTPQHYQMRKKERKCEVMHSDVDSYIKLTFENLKFSLMASKELVDAWLKIICNLQSSCNFRCIDLIILIILFNCLHGKNGHILQIMRNKIKSEVLNENHVEDMFKILLTISEEYSSTVLEVASVLVRTYDSKISSFGAKLYKECFAHFHIYMKQIVISEILLHIGSGLSASINTALLILKDLCVIEKEALRQHTTSILGILVKVTDLDLIQVRLLMDVISDLIFSDLSGSETAAQDELQIFIRKHLTSSKLDHCKKGILAAIMYMKHFGKERCSEGSIHFHCNSLLDFITNSSGMSETKRGFFNDEFATMIKESKLSKPFLELWCNKTFDLIRDNLFLKDLNIEYTCLDYPASPHYSLHDENFEKLIFPIVDLINKSNNKLSLNVAVSVIPSTLRLFWCLQGNLNRILPVFYASVIMPKSTVYENFNTLEDSQKKIIINCLFLCANYIIESVNALCAHGILDKAVLRIKQLLDVRQLIAKCIDKVPEFVPPQCQFHSLPPKVLPRKRVLEKKPRRGQKRKLNEICSEASTSLMDSSADKIPPSYFAETIFPPQQQQQAAQKTDLHLYSHFFREFDFQTNKLLSTSFKLDTICDGQGGTSVPCSVVNPGLGTCELLFLLKDLAYKSEQLLKPTEESLNFKSQQDSRNVLKEKITPERFIVESLKIFPDLLNKIETLSNTCKNLLELNGWNYNARGLYVPGACDVKLAMAAGLKFIANIISWNGFQNSNEKILEGILSVLAREGIPSKINASFESLEALAIASAHYLAKFSKTVLVLPGALSIVKSFQACLRYSSFEPCDVLAKLCHEFLCRNWFTEIGAPDRGALYNQHIDFLLKTYFSFVTDKFEVIRSCVETALCEIGELSEKDSFLKTFKTINKSNFPLLYRTMCEVFVVTSVDEFSKAGEDHEKQLHIWTKVVETLLNLVDIAKLHSSRVILASLLKRSQSIIQLFLGKGMPVVESALRVKSTEVLTLLKSFQMVTRFLHSICCHSRITNDSVVATHVPGIRSLCERLTLEVKGMLILNGIPMDCITIAILKNRDIKGNDIVSQNAPVNAQEHFEKPKLCCSVRFLFSAVSFVALFNMAYVRFGISMALVCMVFSDGKNKDDNEKRGEFAWSSSTKGYIISAAFYGFLVGPFVAGFLSYKVGGKIIIIFGTIGTSVTFFLAPESARKSPILFFAVRVLSGFFCGFTLPAFYGLASQWVVPEERQLLVTGSLVGIPTASILNFPLSSTICAVCGWIWLFYSMGLWLFICGFAYYFLYFNYPENCPYISESELLFLKSHLPSPAKFGVPWKTIVKSLPIYAYIVIHFCVNYVSLSIIFSLPLLMRSVYNFELQENGLLSATPFVGSFVVRIIVSIFFEKLRKKLKLSKNTLRKIFVFTGAVLFSLFIFTTTFLTSSYRYWVIVCFVLATSSLELCLSAGYLLSLLDLCPSYVNLLTGVINTVANAAGLVCPVVTGLITSHGTKEEWNVVFYIDITILLVAMVFYLVFGQNHLQSWGLATMPSHAPN